MLGACVDVDQRGLYQRSTAVVLMKTMKTWAGRMYTGSAMLLVSVKKVKTVSLESAGHYPTNYLFWQRYPPFSHHQSMHVKNSK